MTLKWTEEQMESRKLTIVKLFKWPTDENNWFKKKLIFEIKFGFLPYILRQNFNCSNSVQQP